MSKNSSLEKFGKIEVKTPCSEKWEEMRGTETVRFCSHCDLHVNNLSAMTRKQAMKIVRQSSGRICVRYVKNPQTSEPIFREKLYQISRRAGIAAGVLGASLSLSAVNLAQSEAKTVEAESQIVRLSQPHYLDSAEDNNAPQTTTENAAGLSGILSNADGKFIANTSVSLFNQTTNESRVALSDEKGFYEFKDLSSGVYKLRIDAADGFAEIENIKIANAEIRKDVSLTAYNAIQVNVNVPLMETVTMGMMVSVRHYTPLFEAVADGDLEKVKTLVAKGEKVNQIDKGYENITPLFLAVENGSAEVAETLLNFGAKINARDNNKQTPLMRLDDDATPALVNLLIKHGAKVNAADDEGNTALMLAAYSAKAEILQILITGGADVNAQNKEGATALMNAAEEGNLENVRALILAGANVNLKNEEGESAWDLASDDEIEKLLELHGAAVQAN